jgi:hypothetical protein
MSESHGDWDHSKQLAKAVLHDRGARRKVMSVILAVVLALMIAGLWLVDGWLSRNPWCFVTWWAVCGVLTLVLMLFAVHDALAVVREERDNHR